MDKAILKKFAIESRQDLMVKMENKVKSLYIDEGFSKQQNGEIYVLSNHLHTLNLTKEEFDKRDLLIKRIKELGLEQVIEESAYTWFNRIIAIRYMEINDYLPLTKDNQSLGIRVLSSKDNTPDPEIMKFTNLINPELDINFNKEKYIELKDEDTKFKYILIQICKKLGRVIPQVFDDITDYIDILIPDNLLNESGFIYKLIKEVPEDNFNEVEIIGWLYQYYNQTEKDRVISAKKAYKKKEIPYATQLFTPDWIVKYMVENSLGRYYVEHNGDRALYPNDNLYPSSPITNKWKYFIKDNVKINKEKIDVTKIKFIDPCCGSGHILVYAFEVFYQIYEESGYNKNDIPKLILENNIYGLDIDDRAGQLSILSVLLKAREYDKNIFNKINTEELNITSISESNSIPAYLADNISNETVKKQLIELYEDMLNAKEIGSLLQLDKKEYYELEKYIKNDQTIFRIESEQKILPLIKIADILSNKYDIVVTNPPYLKNALLDSIAKKYVEKKFPIHKNDLFSAFIEQTSFLAKKDAYIGLMTPNVWLFISSYEKVRRQLIESKSISSMILPAKGSFFKEATVDICSFVYKNNNTLSNGIYVRLEKYKGDMEAQRLGLINEISSRTNEFVLDSRKFLNIPGCQFAFWVKKFDIFDFKTINFEYESGGRNKTHDNNKYVRKWWEINDYKRWQFYANGGEYRKWYGNHYDVVDWCDDAKNNYVSHGGLYNQKFSGKKGICWNLITSAVNGFRIKPNEFHYSSGSPTIFSLNENYDNYLLAFFNSKVSQYLLDIVNPTLNTTVNDVLNLPLNLLHNNRIEELVNENIELSKEDWNLNETSYDFSENSLISEKNKFHYGKTDGHEYLISDCFKHLETSMKLRFDKVKSNEEEINKYFIELYGMQDELTSKIDDKNITLKHQNEIEEIKSLISYFVGCLFGRYSLDEEGLVFAGGEFDVNRYTIFKPDSDNIIPITDEAYFGDDIVSRFKKFIEVVYGKETLNENLDFIAETLGKKGTETSEETIRRYFLNDFYADHVKMYQKKPIYWLFDSGKKNGFKALIYMHRYNENTVPKVRLDYLHRIQTTYEKLLTDINYKLTTDLSMTDKKEAQKRQVDLNNKLTEIKAYDEKIAHIANQRISIDLDDGVTVNYAKFADILAKIK